MRGLSPSARPIARELVQWREQTAARQDRPVQSVLSDAALMEIAKRKPALRRASSSRSAAPARRTCAGAARSCCDVVAARARAARPSRPRARRARRAPKPEDAPLIALGEALLRARAREAGLAYELLAARADLQAIVAAWRTGGEEADVRTLRGWRRELVGERAARAARRQVSLSVARREASRTARRSSRRPASALPAASAYLMLL